MIQMSGFVFLVASLLSLVEAQGAGRAFPVASENLAISLFQGLNSRIRWDPTNFLPDLAGYYANCDNVRTRNTVNVDRTMEDGSRILAYVDNGPGTEAHVNAVNGYIETILRAWTRRGGIIAQLISDADFFGCSVRPSCGSNFVVACLFSPVTSGDQPPEEVVTPTPNGGGILARAFTEEQYVIAERITGLAWDRSHLLENLSGLETSCGMVGRRDWQFSDRPADYDVNTVGVFDYSPNLGSTGDALEIILNKLKPKIPGGVRRQIGCSVIPDCISSGTMYVVVSCLYQQ